MKISNPFFFAFRQQLNEPSLSPHRWSPTRPFPDQMAHTLGGKSRSETWMISTIICRSNQHIVIKEGPEFITLELKWMVRFGIRNVGKTLENREEKKEYSDHKESKWIWERKLRETDWRIGGLIALKGPASSSSINCDCCKGEERNETGVTMKLEHGLL